MRRRLKPTGANPPLIAAVRVEAHPPTTARPSTARELDERRRAPATHVDARLL